MFGRWMKEPLFEGEGTGGAGTAPIAETQAPAAPMNLEQRIGDMWEKSQVEEPVVDNPVEVKAPETDTPPAQAQPETKILGKYDQDGLVKAFQNIQGAYTKDHQALLDATKVIEQLKADKEAILAKQQEPTPAPVTDELEALDDEAYLDRLYKNPKEFVKKIREDAKNEAKKDFDSRITQLEGRLSPVVEHTEAAKNQAIWNDAVTAFAEQNVDMKDFIDGMKEYIAENNLQNSKEPEKVLKYAYGYAKGLKYSAPVDPKAMLKDENFRKELLNDADLQTEFAKAQIARTRTNQQQIPPTINGNSAGNAAAMPPAKATSIGEATRRAADRIFGGG